MKKRFRSLAALLLALALLLSAVPVQAEEKPDTWIADRTITVQAYIDYIGYSMPKDFSATAVGKKIKELTGITLDVRYTPGDNDTAVMTAQFAAGNIADVILSYLNNSTRPEFPALYKAAQEGMFADLTDLLPNTKVFSKYLDKDYLPADSYNNITFRKDLDGAYILHLRVDAVDNSTVYDPLKATSYGLFIRSDIAEALNVDVSSIRTSQQMYDLCVAIRDGGFKDDNGDPVYPVGPKYWGGGVGPLEGVIPDLYAGISSSKYALDKDGKAHHDVETDFIYERIAFVRKMLAEGLINPEFFTMDGTRAMEAAETGNSAIIAGVDAYQSIIYTNDRWLPLGPLADRTGYNGDYTTGKGGNGVMAISADAEKPEEILAFFDFLSTYEGQLLGAYGVEGVSYEMVDGKPVIKEEVKAHLDAGDTAWLSDNIGASFGVQGYYFFYYAVTDLQPMAYFGENRPGSGSSTTYSRAIELATKYPREIKRVKGLTAESFLALEQFADLKMQLSLLDYNEMFVQACFAETEEQVRNIVETYRAQLKSAGIGEFEAYLEKLHQEEPDSLFIYQEQ